MGEMTKRWLVTGGCGFIGTSLIKRLISEGGYVIRVLDNLSVGTRKDLATVCTFTETPDQGNIDTVELIIGDIRDPDVCQTCCKGIDVIIHLAANTGVPGSVENPRLDMECNVIGTFNMLEAARINQVKRFVFASSGSPVGECAPPIHEELPPHPVSPYGASKLAGEGYCSAYAKTFGVETVALRFSNVYGPGSTHKSSVVAKFIKQALNGETLVIYGDGTQTRDFIYIDDLIEAIYKAATILPPLCSKLSLGGETFQIATSSETTLDEITELLLRELKENDVPPPKVEKIAPRLGDVKRNFSDTKKAAKVLGWKSRYNLDRGLAKTVIWFLNGTDEQLLRRA
jgi:UDP-glucose 4-epimerase